jgi:hypothetical protein
MTAGAAIAAVAAARRRRLAEVAEAFRAARATAPDRARSLGEVLAGYESEVAMLADAGVLVTVLRDGRWYLDEAAYAAWLEASQRARRRQVVTAVGLALLAGVVVLLAFLLGAPRGPSR